jgi:hypothetical protein
LTRRLADYVQRRAAQQLWPVEAARVTQAIGCGQLDLAIDIYFANSNHRWDTEHLHTESVAPLEALRRSD